MEALNKDDRLRIISGAVTEAAARIAQEELRRYEKEHSDAIVDSDIKDLVGQRAMSELMLRACNFKPAEEIAEEKALQEQFQIWFAAGEEKNLRSMCYSVVGNELAKRCAKGDENLTFTERFIRNVRQSYPGSEKKD